MSLWYRRRGSFQDRARSAVRDFNINGIWNPKTIQKRTRSIKSYRVGRMLLSFSASIPITEKRSLESH